MKYKKTIVFILITMCISNVGCAKLSDKLFNNKSSDESKVSETKEMYCSNCGYGTKEPTKYCPNCGQEAKWVAEKPSKENIKNNNNQNNSKENTSNNNQSTPNNSQRNNNSQNTISRKNEYLNKLDQIQIEVDNLNESCGESDQQIRATQEVIYKKWDDMLNEIYSLIKKDLSSSEAHDLKTKELAWIKYRDKKAENDAENGEFSYSILYSDSLIESTKERCYELVNEYM